MSLGIHSITPCDSTKVLFVTVCVLFLVTVSASSVRNDWSGLEGKEPRLLLHTCLVLLSQGKLEDFFRYVQYLLFGQLPPHIVIDHEPGNFT